MIDTRSATTDIGIHVHADTPISVELVSDTATCIDFHVGFGGSVVIFFHGTGELERLRDAITDYLLLEATS
jgi:hypothetical protein